MIKKLGIRTPSINQKTLNLSGGNQQKTVIAKWLFAEPDILIMDEPTRGIDVGAKFEIYQLMNAMVAEGKAIIMISSELPEVLGMSDRLMVMSNGRVQSILDKEEYDANIVMEKSIGLSGKD
jgi:ABC-type sugar transport system ATPase subunit